MFLAMMIPFYRKRGAELARTVPYAQTLAVLSPQEGEGTAGGRASPGRKTHEAEPPPGLPRRFAPRNDEVEGLARRFAPENDVMRT
jgi:hypothetical protein